MLTSHCPIIIIHNSVYVFTHYWGINEIPNIYLLLQLLVIAILSLFVKLKINKMFWLNALQLFGDTRGKRTIHFN